MSCADGKTVCTFLCQGIIERFRPLEFSMRDKTCESFSETRRH